MHLDGPHAQIEARGDLLVRFAAREPGEHVELPLREEPLAARALDERRILWAAGDIVETRPPLSRWHPDFGDAFPAFVKGK